MQLKNDKNNIKNKRKYTKKIILQMSTITRHKLEDHEKILKKRSLLRKINGPSLIYCSKISKNCQKIPLKSKVVFLERNLLYGGYSLFAPFFYKNNVISIDCSMKEIKKRIV